MEWKKIMFKLIEIIVKVFYVGGLKYRMYGFAINWFVLYGCVKFLVIRLLEE